MPVAAPAQSAGAALSTEPATQQKEQLYPVVKVVDGDTVTIEKDGGKVTLRLIGLDTPETVDPRKPVQCFGKEASEKAREVLAGKSVRIETDHSQGELDRYGRLLAYVYTDSGVLFNKLMIEGGFGHEYTYRLPHKYQQEFKDAERDAHANARGLWAPGACASARELPK